MTKEKQTIVIAGINVPLTNKGYPNMVHLPKPIREIVKKHLAEAKSKKEELLYKEVQELLKNLKI